MLGRRWCVPHYWDVRPARADHSQPAPGKIIYDPFVGTGSLLYSVAMWGAYVVGSDIDARQFRGKGELGTTRSGY